MQKTQHTKEEIAQIGDDLYRRDIHDKVMPAHKGKFLILDILSGDYEIDQDDSTAEEVLRARKPEGEFYGLRIGYTSAYTLSGRTIEEAP